MKLINNAFQIILPVLVFMDFIENDQRRRCIFSNNMRKEILVLKEPFPVITDIPIPVEMICK
jgi:hypothetical protein